MLLSDQHITQRARQGCLTMSEPVQIECTEDLDNAVGIPPRARAALLPMLFAGLARNLETETRLPPLCRAFFVKTLPHAEHGFRYMTNILFFNSAGRL